MNEYLTEMETCNRLHVSRFKLFELRKKGLPFRRIGRGIRYIPQEVDAWISKHFNGQDSLQTYKEKGGIS
jgi:predicted DNA-binding transcriptional regulator AlpA